jgi:uncharacterized NAD(P)/FAD-binding protein YdhS
VQLLREDRAPFTVTIIEGRETLGQGLAYCTRDDGHLLNTRNARSSAIEDDDTHFLRWLEHSGQPAVADGYSMRREYSRYLQHTLDDAAAQANAWGSRLCTRIGRRATDVDREHEGFRVWLDDGEVIDCAQVVLASGYGPPADPLAGMLPLDCGRYIRNPWQGALPPELERRDSVLLIGTGLTMVDMALSLHRRGHRGTMHTLSRRGLLPRAHRAEPAHSLPFALRQDLYADLTCGTLSGLAKAVRRAAAEAELRGLGWQAVIDALRPLSAGIWQALGETDQRRFLRHLRPYFDAHRHRLAPAPAATLASMVGDGRLQLRAGRIRGATDYGDMILVPQRLRGTTSTRHEPYRWVINCTGASLAAHGRHSLEAHLLAKGLVSADRHQLGFLCNRAGAISGPHGVVPGLYMIGPACRSHPFEHTAIPELRRQAAELASLIAEGRARAHPERWMPVSALTHIPQRPPWGRSKTPPGLPRATGELLR